MSTIKIFAHNSMEHRRLETAAAMLTAYNGNGDVWTVEDLYFDFGQDWKWTTLVCHGKNGSSYQVYPVEQESVVLAMTPAAMAEAVEKMLQKKF